MMSIMSLKCHFLSLLKSELLTYHVKILPAKLIFRDKSSNNFNNFSPEF